MKTVRESLNYSQENIQLFIVELILESNNWNTSSLVKEFNIAELTRDIPGG